MPTVGWVSLTICTGQIGTIILVGGRPDLPHMQGVLSSLEEWLIHQLVELLGTNSKYADVTATENQNESGYAHIAVCVERSYE